MSLPHAILGVLATGPRHGRAVVRALARLLEGLRPVGAGQVYATLERLTRQHLIETTDATACDARGRTRRAYALTPAGRRALRRWLEGAELDRETACGFVARLIVLHALDDTRGVARLLAARRARLVALQAAVAARARSGDGRVGRDHTPGADDDVARMVHEAALRLVAGELAWLVDAERSLLAGRDTAPRT